MPQFHRTVTTRVLCFLYFQRQPLRTPEGIKAAGNRINTANSKMRVKYSLLIIASVLAFVSCTPTKTIPLQPASQTYKIGDGYNRNGVKGIVVKVDASGQHGLVMSLESSKEKWTSNKKFDFETNAFFEDDGEKNMEAIEKYVNSGKATWEDFPLMKWARSLGSGWYIPSKSEAEEIWKNMAGGKLEFKMQLSSAAAMLVKNDFEKFDKAQRQLGGAKLVDDGMAGTHQPYIWFTSTEAEGGMVYNIGITQDLKNMEINLNKKMSTFPVAKRALMRRTRAIHKF